MADAPLPYCPHCGGDLDYPFGVAHVGTITTIVFVCGSCDQRLLEQLDAGER